MDIASTQLDDSKYMSLALEQASKALAQGDVPVGAVIVGLDESQNPLVVSQACNSREFRKDPTAHAEIIALREASRLLGRWRLTGCTLYVTLEPCSMCAGALVLARVDRVVFGARDPKTGAVESLYQVLTDSRLNHQPKVVGGILENDCSKILKDFFASRRKAGIN